MKAGVVLVAIQGEQSCRGKQGIQTKVMTTLFTLFAEVERDTISNRTGEGLAKARLSGKKLERPKGCLDVLRGSSLASPQPSRKIHRPRCTDLARWCARMPR